MQCKTERIPTALCDRKATTLWTALSETQDNATENNTNSSTGI
ncbi:hypothetical protein [Methanosarcina sp. UBA5]|nr:hypothetical protein [Methanosarcina sp. UBA5]